MHACYKTSKHTLGLHSQGYLHTQSPRWRAADTSREVLPALTPGTGSLSVDYHGQGWKLRANPHFQTAPTVTVGPSASITAVPQVMAQEKTQVSLVVVYLMSKHTQGKQLGKHPGHTVAKVPLTYWVQAF